MCKKILTNVFIGAAFTLCAQAATITDGLIAYYPFNGNANNESGQGRNGVLAGSPELVADRFGRADSAYHFSFGANRILMPNLPVDLAPGVVNTVSFWMKWDGLFYAPNDVGAFPFFWGGAAGSSDGPAGSVYLTGPQSWYPAGVETRLGLNAVAGHGETWGISNPAGIQDWIQVVAVFENGELRDGKLFINGQPIAADLFSAPGSPDSIRSWAGSSPAIGGPNTDSERYQFLGSLDDVRLYDRELSAGEVAKLYATESCSVPEGGGVSLLILAGIAIRLSAHYAGRFSAPTPR